MRSSSRSWEGCSAHEVTGAPRGDHVSVKPCRRKPRTLFTAAPRLALRCYRYAVSPLFGVNCRFEPSCSRFAEQALERHGMWRGILMALNRLLRCHPWGAGGFDPVP